MCIHSSQLSTQISSVVIVGADAESVFGDLFEITSDPTNYFIQQQQLITLKLLIHLQIVN